MTDLREASEEYLRQLARDEIDKHGEVRTWEAAEALDRAQHRRSAKIEDSADSEEVQAVKLEADMTIQRNRTREMQKAPDTRKPKYYARHFINAAKKRQYNNGEINLQDAIRLVPIYEG